MATSYSITINLPDDQDDPTLDYLTKVGYEVRLGYPDKQQDRFNLDPTPIPIDSTDNVSPVRESPIKVEFKAVPEVTYWMSYALPNGDIPYGKLKIEPGQIYEFGVTDSEPKIITGDGEENWAPPDGFGFHNGISASPVLYRSEPGDRTQPSLRETILSVWVPGTGIILPPPSSNQIQVWFEKPLDSDASYSEFTTADQSEKFVVPFEPEEFDVEVDYSESRGWELSANRRPERRERTIRGKTSVETTGTVSQRAAPNGIPIRGQTMKKLTAQKRALQS
ncbi:hypothetical protein GJ744_009754 [Endocarpon pusillum]|uniref:Uncharacterized protein n=1 Tax=Endocarpon pusillum TaxID=364733 RepID=A0A8H7AQE2_9EURO|nr:hypothetical protein GJ744_009754 [Endocarpon pusillum]